jgi:hypothetical protein
MFRLGLVLGGAVDRQERLEATGARVEGSVIAEHPARGSRAWIAPERSDHADRIVVGSPLRDEAGSTVIKLSAVEPAVVRAVPKRWDRAGTDAVSAQPGRTGVSRRV